MVNYVCIHVCVEELLQLLYIVSCSQYENRMEPAHTIHYLLLHFTTPEVMYAPAKSKTPVYVRHTCAQLMNPARFSECLFTDVPV